MSFWCINNLLLRSVWRRSSFFRDTKSAHYYIHVCLGYCYIIRYLDFKGGSVGKRVAGLKVYFTHRSFSRSLVRNGIKFLPWQIGHMAVIHGVYTRFDVISIVLSIISCILLVIIFLMGTMRYDRRHLGDMVAGTQVQLAKHR